MKNTKNFLFFTFLAFIISIIVNLTYLNIGIKNHLTEGYLYPNPSTTSYVFEHHDIDDNFQWVRRAYENNSIFQLSANISEVERENSKHFQSSRGLSYYLAGFSLSIFEETINVIIFSKIFFLTISIFLFFKIIDFYHKENSIKILIVCLSLMFATKLFGGVLNPFHYIEYFFQIKEFFTSRSIDRIPNILISNIFVVGNFLLIKKYFKTKNNLIFLFYSLFLGISGFVTPIIFIIYTMIILTIELHNFLKIRDVKIFVLKTLLLLGIFFPIMYFHITNLNSINDDSLNSPQWTGNYLYDLEIFFGPLLLIFIFFYKKIKEFYLEIIYFTAQAFLYIPVFFYDVYLASKINENFIYLNAVISFSLLFKFFYIKKDINLKYLLILAILCFVYLFIQHGVDIKIFLILVFIPIYLLLNHFMKKKLVHFFLGLLSFFLLFNFSYNHYLKNDEVFSNISQRDLAQKKLIQFLNKKNYKNTYLSLDFGILKNVSIHTDQNVYFINITNTNLTEKILTNRLYDIIYLHGFDILDLQDYLEDIDYSNNANLEPQERIKKILLKNLYHHQIYHKEKIIKKLLDGYKNYLLSNKHKLIKNFDRCIVNFDNLNTIKNNSFIFEVIKSKPIYEYSNYKIYNCKLNE